MPEYRAYWAVAPPGEGYPPDDGGGHGDEMDYLLDDQYIHDEHRFFCSPGWAEDEVRDVGAADCWLSEQAKAAYLAAKGARFEHGESGAPSQRSTRRRRDSARAVFGLDEPWTPRVVAAALPLWRGNATQFLSQLAAKGIRVSSLGGGTLDIQAPPGALTDEIRTLLREHRQDVETALQRLGGAFPYIEPEGQKP